jgi:pimeloyl-ACP methyl ester carboxylesterase
MVKGGWAGFLPEPEAPRACRGVSTAAVAPTLLALQRYRGPTLAVVTPESDQPYEIHKLVPGSPHKVVTGTSHWLDMDKPEEFNRILDEFLDERVGKTE